MTPLDQQEQIFNEALRREGDERAKYLREACAGDGALLQQIEALICMHQDDTPSVLDQDAPGDGEALVGESFQGGTFQGVVRGLADAEGVFDQALSVGDQIGVYKLVECIGEGGMGVVFAADQVSPVRRRVAMKIIKLGMDTRKVVARFEAERQALTRMEHPSITRVFDAGVTPSGRSYFVMEMVSGVSITAYCKDHDLPLNERLMLFVEVCHAVHHAHQKGVIHRDLKPSNILVAKIEDQAVPKVIDFGIAKAIHQPLTDVTLFTRIGDVMGTLDYMSPEQMDRRDDDVDTRSDVYALGVVLYELLTGVAPLAGLRELGYDKALDAARTQEPMKPSGMVLERASLCDASGETEPSGAGIRSQMLRGDLDWIVLKCLEKQRERRYDSAASLARDLQCYLHGEPTEAAAPSLRYTMGKFYRKHRAVVIGGSLCFVLLVTGVLVSGVLAESYRRQAHRAQAAETLATQRLQELLVQKNRADTSERQMTEAKRQQLNEQALRRAHALYVHSQSEAERPPAGSVLPQMLEADDLERHRAALKARGFSPQQIEAAMRAPAVHLSEMDFGEGGALSPRQQDQMRKSLEAQGAPPALIDQILSGRILQEKPTLMLPGSSHDSRVRLGAVQDSLSPGVLVDFIAENDPQLLTRMLEEQRHLLGSNDPFVNDTRLRLVRVLTSQGQANAAFHHAQAAMASLTQAPGTPADQMARAHLLMAIVQAEQGNRSAAQQSFVAAELFLQGAGAVSPPLKALWEQARSVWE